MANALNSFEGSVIYVDTMLPYMLLRGIDESVKPFFERLERGELAAYTSVLTFDELGYRLLLALIKDQYAGSPLDQLRAAEEKMMTEFAPTVATLLRRLREYTALTIVEILSDDLEVMSEAMIQFHLRPRDGLHYAAMKRLNCFDVASNDAHFDRVSHLKRYSI